MVEGGKLDLADKIISATTGHKIERPEWMPNRQRGVERLEQGGKVLQEVIENPKMLWQAVADPIKEDWNAGGYGEATGRTEFLLIEKNHSNSFSAFVGKGVVAGGFFIMTQGIGNGNYHIGD